MADHERENGYIYEKSERGARARRRIRVYMALGLMASLVAAMYVKFEGDAVKGILLMVAIMIYSEIEIQMKLK